MTITIIIYFLSVLAVAAWVFAWAETFLKAGFNKWLCFLMIVPVVNLYVFVRFAFRPWPVYEYVEKGWAAKRIKTKKRELEKQLAELEGRPYSEEKALEEVPSPATTEKRVIFQWKTSTVLATALAAAVIFLAIGWSIGWSGENDVVLRLGLEKDTLLGQISSLKNELLGENTRYATALNRIDEYKKTIDEHKKTITNIENQSSYLEMQNYNLRLEIESKEFLIKRSQAENSATYSFLLTKFETLQKSYDVLINLFPPKEFKSRDALKAWVSSKAISANPLTFNKMTTTEAYIRALEIQKAALSDGFVVSVAKSQYPPELATADLKYVYLLANTGDGVVWWYPDSRDIVWTRY